jgi:MFS family permease
MPKKREKENGFRNVFLLGESSFFNDVGSEMMTPILPFYITALGGTGLAVGLVSGAREGLSSVLKFFGGWLSDRTGKRGIFVFLGYVLSVIFRFMISVVNSWQYIVAFVALERVGKLRDAPRDALISESVKKKRGRAFGIHQMLDTLGGVVGTLLVILFFWKLNMNIKLIIIIASVMSIFSLLPIFFVHEPKTKKMKRSLFSSIKDLDKNLKYFIFVTSVFTLGNFGLYLLLILRAQQLSGTVLLPLILYAIFGLVSSLCSKYFGKFSDKVGRKNILMFGYVLFFLLCLGFIFLQNLVLFSILFALYGIVYGVTQTIQRAYVSDVSGKAKGTAFGFFNCIVGLVNIAGGLIAGILWDVSYTTMFIYLSVVAFISIIFLIFVKKK